MSALLEVREVSKSFGGVQAVNRVSVDVNDGDLLSVIGPNGAGKTTLLNMISGFYHPDSGKISLGGDDVTHIPPFKVAERGVARSQVVLAWLLQSSPQVRPIVGVSSLEQLEPALAAAELDLDAATMARLDQPA